MSITERKFARVKNTPLFRQIISRSLIAAASLLLPAFAVADQAPSPEFEALRGALERLGWQIERSGDGDLLLWPPGQQREATPTARVEQPAARRNESMPATNLESLKDELAARGWQVRTGEDGSLLLDVSPAQPAPATPATKRPLEQSEWFEHVGDLLQTQGWHVEREQSGTLTVYPQRVARVQRGDFTLIKVKNTELERASASLSAAGWRLEQQPDQTLLLSPDSGTVSRRDTKTERPQTQTGFVDLADSADIKLPVDTAGKAHRIAKVWLDRQPRNDLAIGRINRVHWVYLVDIFRNTPPFYLHNQLAIRYRDGRLVPLL